MNGPELIPVILAAIFAGSTVLILARAALPASGRGVQQ